MSPIQEHPVSGARYEHARFVDLRLEGALDDVRFDDCVFERCDLRELRLHRCQLVDTDLEACDLTLVDVQGTTFGGVTLTRCRAAGVAWSRAKVGTDRPLGLDAKDSVLNFCSFAGLVLAKRRFEGCTIHEALFEGCDLRDASLRRSDLYGTTFRDCDLRGADLRTARRYAIDVRHNRVAGMRVALPEAAALLEGLEVDLS
jgi:fluoroquinolone resistance protein